jgi:hypothetical protein
LIWINSPEQHSLHYVGDAGGEGKMASRNWSIFKAWKGWKTVCAGAVDSDVCSEHELKRTAEYLGIPVAQLRWVSSHRLDPISLLERRMEALSLKLDEVEHTDPFTAQELRQRCVKCERPEKCAWDLADELIHLGGRSWRDYCPNAATLAMLSTLQAASADDPARAVHKE